MPTDPNNPPQVEPTPGPPIPKAPEIPRLKPSEERRRDLIKKDLDVLEAKIAATEDLENIPATVPERVLAEKIHDAGCASVNHGGLECNWSVDSSWNSESRKRWLGVARYILTNFTAK
jgi:hypothetical protein